MKFVPPEKYYKTLPKKRMGSGVLFFDEGGQLLILNPTYKDYWTIPGGTVDENESPMQTAIRETKEEIGLDIKNMRFLCVDYTGDDKKGEALQFMFYGGILNPEQVKNIVVPKDEIGEYKFEKIENAAKLFGQGRTLGLKMPICLKAIRDNTSFYLENGKMPRSIAF